MRRGSCTSSSTSRRAPSGRNRSGRAWRCQSLSRRCRSSSAASASACRRSCSAAARFGWKKPPTLRCGLPSGASVKAVGDPLAYQTERDQQPQSGPDDPDPLERPGHRVATLPSLSSRRQLPGRISAVPGHGARGRFEKRASSGSRSRCSPKGSRSHEPPAVWAAPPGVTVRHPDDHMPDGGCSAEVAGFPER